jgi:hypothetical protein
VTHPATTVPVCIGTHRMNLPAELLAGAAIRIRLPRSPITRDVDGVRVVVGDSGTDWIDKVVLPVGECRPDPLTDPDAEDAPHQSTICPECIDSWACDWQIELVLAVDGSGEG